MVDLQVINPTLIDTDRRILSFHVFFRVEDSEVGVMREVRGEGCNEWNVLCCWWWEEEGWIYCLFVCLNKSLSGVLRDGILFQ